MHGAALLDRRIVDIPDAADAPAELAAGAQNFLTSGNRAITIMPMMRGDEAIGLLSVVRLVPGPLSDKQIAVLRTFAAQAVIAIENTRLLNELRQRTDDLSESLEQQTATSEVLKVISSSPGELPPVFNTMLANATRICEAKFGVLYLREGGAFRAAATTPNAPPEWVKARKPELLLNPPPDGPLRRITATKQVVQIADLSKLQSYLERHPFTVAAVELGRFRTALGVPMLKDGEVVGAITILRQEVRPFTDKQIKLMENFAAQAVIAIENTRLLNELRESLQQQTATADVLKVISSSPGELEPVFNAILESATRICEARFGTLYLCEGEAFRLVAMNGIPPEIAAKLQGGPRRVAPNTALGRVAVTKETVRIADVRSEAGYFEVPPGFTPPQLSELAGVRTIIAVPMLRENELVGAILIYRQEVRPFTDKQIALVTNFASQAVIAIENGRLLNELRESLQQQTATADVLKVISSSPGELDPVFQAMLANAVRICEARFGTLWVREDNAFRAVATHNVPAAFAELRRREPLVHPRPGSVMAKLISGKEVVESIDITTEKAYRDGDPALVALAEIANVRTFLGVPLLKDNEVIGAIGIYRQEVRPFTEKQIELVKNFAAQAVIAIENTRLLNELRESLQQQTATADVLKVISSSPGELEPVFDTMLANAVHVCGANFGVMHRYDGGAFCNVAMHNVPPAFAEMRRSNPVIRPSPGTGLGRVERTKKVVQILDLKSEQTYRDRVAATVAMVELAGARTLLVVPMLKHDVLLGTIAIYRQEVRPFTDKQIDLVQNFAAQAVIAIENTRLLNELRQRTDDLSEALEQQTATSEVLKVISSSPGELEPVFQAMLENATRICQAKYGVMFLHENDTFRARAMCGAPPALAEERQRNPVIRPPPRTGVGRVLRTKKRLISPMFRLSRNTSMFLKASRDQLLSNSAARGRSLPSRCSKMMNWSALLLSIVRR